MAATTSAENGAAMLSGRGIIDDDGFMEFPKQLEGGSDYGCGVWVGLLADLPAE